MLFGKNGEEQKCTGIVKRILKHDLKILVEYQIEWEWSSLGVEHVLALFFFLKHAFSYRTVRNFWSYYILLCIYALASLLSIHWHSEKSYAKHRCQVRQPWGDTWLCPPQPSDLMKVICFW